MQRNKLQLVILFIFVFIINSIAYGKDFRNWSRSYLGSGQKRHGSGFFVNSQHVVTNNHVIEGCSKFMARTRDGSPIKMSLAAVDVPGDLAVLKADNYQNQSFGYLYDKDVQWASLVHIIGYPNNYYKYDSSAVVHVNYPDAAFCGKPCNQTRLLYTDVDNINNGVGLSGGPLLNSEGSIVGVLDGYMTVEANNKGKNEYIEVGTAIEIYKLKEFLYKNLIPYYNSSQRYNGGTVEKAIEEYGNEFIVQVHCKLGR